MHNTIIIDLGDGDSAELFAEMRHGTIRAIEQLYRPYFERPEYQEILKLDSFEERQKALLPLVIGSDEIARATDLMILGQVKSWTFGEVNQAVLDDIPERKHQILSQEANKLYEAPLPGCSART